MPDIQVTMAASGPTADVPTGSKAQLNLPAGSSPASWTKNDVAWAAPPAPALVDPTIGGDDVYKVVDQNGIALSAVVRWKPNPPDNVTLTPGEDNTSVTWDAIGDESKIDYYQVDLDPRPSTAQLPRKVMVGAGARGTKRVLSLQGLPPNSYTAAVFAVREGNGGAVSSEPATSSSGTVLPTTGPYSGPVRIFLAIIGLAAVGGAAYLLVTNLSPARAATTRSTSTAGHLA